jgi:hypothetical protein
VKKVKITILADAADVVRGDLIVASVYNAIRCDEIMAVRLTNPLVGCEVLETPHGLEEDEYEDEEFPDEDDEAGEEEEESDEALAEEEDVAWVIARKYYGKPGTKSKVVDHYWQAKTGLWVKSAHQASRYYTVDTADEEVVRIVAMEQKKPKGYDPATLIRVVRKE